MDVKFRWGSFVPLGLFVALFLGVGVHLYLQGIERPFCQISPSVCILPSLVVGVFFTGRSYRQNIAIVIESVGHPTIVTMCFIFLLSGAFGSITQTLGGVDAIVQTTVRHIPSSYLLISLFVASAVVSTAIGTSMGVIALVVPFAVSMAQQGAFAEAIGVATVVSGSMFGDNLSIVSDTTIAAVTTQGADPRKKFALNARVAIVAAVVTVVILACLRSTAVTLPTEGALNLWKTLPYVLLFFGVVILKWDVVGGLLMAISVATLMALADGTSPVVIGQSLYSGMQGMNEVLVISLFVGGLRGLLRAQGGMDFIVRRIEKWIRRKSTSRCCEFVVAGTVSLFDILLGNNTLAIIASGHMAQTLAHNFGVPAHRSAYLLDVFACIFQGILPYAPQILLASSLSGVAIFDIVGKVYYCYVLLLICIVEVCGHYRKGGVTAIS